jgi:hypothetical protein
MTASATIGAMGLANVRPKGTSRRITDIFHRDDVGPSHRDNGARHFSAENNGHGSTSPCTPRSYRDEQRMSSSKNVTSVISDDEIRSSLDEIFLTRPVKEVSAETGFSVAALNKWRANGGVPQWIVEGFVLTVKNTRIWAAAKRLRMLEDAAELDRQIAELQGLRRGMVHEHHKGNRGVSIFVRRNRLHGHRQPDFEQG